MVLRITQSKFIYHTINTVLLLLATSVSSSLFAETLTGTLDVVWGDSQKGKTPGQIDYSLAQSNGTSTPLLINESTITSAGGISKLMGKYVVVDISAPLAQKKQTNNIFKTNVESITLLNSASSITQNPISQVQGLSGPQQYVSILCKFSDKPAEPQNWNFFDNMYGASAGQLGHFWEEVSSNNINLTGSRAYGGTAGNNGWYTLPSPRSSYVNAAHPSGDLAKLFNDCVDGADSHIDFTNIKGINLMFNDTIGPYAWGGSFNATLDGVTKSWPTTWEPTWGWANVTVMAHEMGHSFGLPHSNNSDGDSNPYDSPWSVMSDAWNYGVQDATYGTRGKHVNSYEKNRLSWLTSGETFTAPDGETHSLNIDSLSDNLAGAGAYRMVKVPFVTESKYYTVEARETTGNYEANLPGTAIIIHSVDESRNEPSWVVDKDNPAGGSGDTEGVMWKVGEVFTDTANNVTITVNSTTTNGFHVTVDRGGEILTPLDQATLITPSGTITNAIPTYNWNAVADSTSYYLWVDDSTGNVIKKWYTAAEAGCDNGTGTCSITPTTLLADGAGKWYIQTKNSAENGPWSSAMNFTVSTIATPSPATLITPMGTINDSTPTYTWNAVSNATWYYLWVDDSTGNVIKKWYTAAVVGCDSGTGTCSITPTTTLADGAGKWYILTYNAVGNGPWSNAMNFSVSPLAPPLAATLVSPTDTISDSTPIYTWNAVPGSTWYYLWGDDSTGNKIKKWYTSTQAGCSTGTGTCTVTPTTPLVNGAGTWWIQTWNSAGKGPWSSGMGFNISAP